VLEQLFHNLIYYHVPYGANNHGCNRSAEYFRRITYNKSATTSVDINSIYSNRDDRNLWNIPKRFFLGTFHNSPSSQILNFQQLEARTKLDKIVNIRSQSNTCIKCIRVFRALLGLRALVIFHRQVIILWPQLMNRGLTLLAHDNLHIKYTRIR